MSLAATIWAWNQQVSASEKLVLLSLAHRANKKHVCWPTIKRLSADTSLNRETVMKSVKSLEKRELIEAKRTCGKGNSYHLVGINSGYFETTTQASKTNDTDQTENSDPSEIAHHIRSGFPDQDQSENPDSNLSRKSKTKPTTSSSGGWGVISDHCFLKAKDRWPEYDLLACYQHWEQWSQNESQKNGTVIRNYDAAFIAWMETNAKDRLPPPPPPAQLCNFEKNALQSLQAAFLDHSDASSLDTAELSNGVGLFHYSKETSNYAVLTFLACSEAIKTKCNAFLKNIPIDVFSSLQIKRFRFYTPENFEDFTSARSFDEYFTLLIEADQLLIKKEFVK